MAELTPTPKLRKQVPILKEPDAQASEQNQFLLTVIHNCCFTLVRSVLAAHKRLYVPESLVADARAG